MSCGFCLVVVCFVGYLLTTSRANPDNPPPPAVLPTNIRQTGRHQTEGYCVQVPIADPYPCEKQEEVERAYPCDDEVEREVCSYVQHKNQEKCSRVKKQIIEYPCFTVKKEKTCWQVPTQKNKKCKKTVKRQTEIESERTVRREVCAQEEMEVSSTCYREEKQTMAYMCYRTHAVMCKMQMVEVDSQCKKTKRQRSPYECTKTVMKRVCEELPSSQNKQTSSHAQDGYHPSDPVCRMKALAKKSTCYRTEEIQAEEPCKLKQLKQVCAAPKPQPDTCHKVLPILKEYVCNVKRHREACKMIDIPEKTIDYIDDEKETEFNCPTIEQKKKCVSFDLVVPDICQKEVQIAETYPCPTPIFKEICEVKPMTTPHTCYSIDRNKRKHTCYQVRYKMQCFNR